MRELDRQFDVPVLVVGGGPAGMAIASCLKKERVDYVQVDRRGQLGGAYRSMNPATELLSPRKYTTLPGLPHSGDAKYISAAEYAEYLDRYATSEQVEVVPATVQTIAPSESGFDVGYRGCDQPRQHRMVVLATGIFDHPVIPSIDGLNASEDFPKVIHSRDWRGCDPYRDQRVLIIGAGMSGVEIAEQCAEAGMTVTISSRKGVRLWRRRVLGIDVHHFAHLVSHRLPRWVAGSYCRRLPALGAFDRGFRQFCRTDRIRKRGEVQRFETSVAHFVDGTSDAFDVVVMATGYRWHPPCLPTGVELGEQGQPLTAGGTIREFPGLYVIGAPCGRILPSEFLHGINHDAPVLARKIARRLRRPGQT